MSNPRARGGRRTSARPGPAVGIDDRGPAELDEPLERRALKNSARLMSALLMSWALSLAGRFLMPRVLGTDRFGQLAFIEGVAVLSMAIVTFGVGGYISREVAIDRSVARRFAVPLSRIQVMSGAAITAALALGFAAASGREQAMIALVFGIGQVAIVLSRTDASYLQAVHDVRVETVSTIVTKAIWFAILIALVGAGIEMMALPIAVAVSESVRALWLRRAMRSSFDLGRRRPLRNGFEVIVKSFPYFLNALNVLFLHYAVRTIVALLGSEEAAGFITVAELLVFIPLLLTPIIGQVTLPMLSSLRAQGSQVLWRRTSQILDMLAIPIAGGCVVLFGVSDPLVELAFGSEFAAAGLAFGLLALAVPADYFTQIVGSALIASGRAWKNTWINFYTMILVIVLASLALAFSTSTDPGTAAAWGAGSLVIGEWITVLALLRVRPIPPLRRATIAGLIVLGATALGLAAIGREVSDPAWLALMSVAVITTVMSLPMALGDIRAILRHGRGGDSELDDLDALADAVDTDEIDDAIDDEHSVDTDGWYDDELHDPDEDDEIEFADQNPDDPERRQRDDEDEQRADGLDGVDVVADDDELREQDDMGARARGERLRGDRAAPREDGSTLDEIESRLRHADARSRVGSAEETTGGNMDLMAARDGEATTAGGSEGDGVTATRRRAEARVPRGGASDSKRGGADVIRLAESDEEESLFSVEPARRWAGYVLGAAKKHFIVFALVFALAGSFLGMFLASSPPLYQTATTILLAGDDGLGATPGQTTAARQQAAEIVLRRDSVDRYIDELGLAENLPDKPFFGQLQEQIFGPLEGEDLRDDLRLQLRLGVFPTGVGEASIVITVLWPDPDQAVAIANMAYDVFIEDRLRIEVEPRERQVEILTSQLAQASTNADNIRDRLRLSPDDGVPLGSALDTAVETEQDLIAELNAAQIALEEARAGVPLRYQLSGAPELPRTPLSNPMILYAATLIAAAIMAFGAVFWLERPKGRVMAPWQVERYGRTIVTTASLDER